MKNIQPVDAGAAIVIALATVLLRGAGSQRVKSLS